MKEQTQETLTAEEALQKDPITVEEIKKQMKYYKNTLQLKNI